MQESSIPNFPRRYPSPAAFLEASPCRARANAAAPSPGGRGELHTSPRCARSKRVREFTSVPSPRRNDGERGAGVRGDVAYERPMSRVLSADPPAPLSPLRGERGPNAKSPLWQTSDMAGYLSATGNRQPATGNRQPATGNRQPTTDNSSTSVGNSLNKNPGALRGSRHACHRDAPFATRRTQTLLRLAQSTMNR